MAISRSQLVKELEPGLNALFGLEYNRYENEHAEIFAAEGVPDGPLFLEIVSGRLRRNRALPGVASW